jgi:hypothetical protein
MLSVMEMVSIIKHKYFKIFFHLIKLRSKKLSSKHLLDFYYSFLLTIKTFSDKNFKNIENFH